MNRICPNCGKIAGYDPYFSAYVCRQCGWESERPTWVDTKKVSIRIEPHRRVREDKLAVVTGGATE